MATMLQVKLGVLILVVGAVAVTVAGDSSVCDYYYTIFTGDDSSAGTDASVLVGTYGMDGRGWTISRSGPRSEFAKGGVDHFEETGRACMDPCHLTLSISGGKSPWYVAFVQITVYDRAADEEIYTHFFEVDDWVYQGYPFQLLQGMCAYKDAHSSSVI
jgi:hypothetical protein